MSDWKAGDIAIVDFAPGCQHEEWLHPIWPVVQGKAVRIEAVDCKWTGDAEHTIWAYVPCDNLDCIFTHFDNGHGNEHRAYFSPDELRHEEPS